MTIINTTTQQALARHNRLFDNQQDVYRLLHRQPICSFLTYVSVGEMPTSRSLLICREELGVWFGQR